MLMTTMKTRFGPLAPLSGSLDTALSGGWHPGERGPDARTVAMLISKQPGTELRLPEFLLCFPHHYCMRVIVTSSERRRFQWFQRGFAAQTVNLSMS